MDERSMTNVPCETTVSDSKIHTNSDSVENIQKLKVKTKNGLVNGVREDKFKSNKKQSKTGVNRNVKETKRNKKDNGLVGEQTNCVAALVSANNEQKCNNIESKCIAQNDIYEGTINSISTKDLNNENNPTKTSQSKLKSVKEPSAGKKKSKLNKSEQNDLPKFDLTSLVNSTVSDEKLVSEMPSTSKMGTFHNQHLLDYPDTSEFERSLIESIKNMKIQQEGSVLANSTQLNLKEINSEENVTVEEQELTDVVYVQYESELQMPLIMKIIQKDLSEPYSIYTYRYFIHNWPKLCFLAMCEEICVGAIVCKLDYHRKSTKRGYIAMLAVDKDYRKRRIGSTLVRRAITEMVAGGADEVVLETEVTNKPALRLYEQLGFVRDKRLFRYYLNGVDALRLKLWLR